MDFGMDQGWAKMERFEAQPGKTPPDNTGIQAEGALAPTPNKETGIAAGPPEDALPLDLDWEKEQNRYSIMSGVGITMAPSRLLAFAVAIDLFMVSVILLEMARWNKVGFWYVISATTATLAIFSFAFIYQKACGFEKRELEWLHKKMQLGDSVGISVVTGNEPQTKRPDWHKTLFVISLFALFLLALDFLMSAMGILWVGRCDLEITFEVTDAQTNAPVVGAEIDIPKSDPGFCADCEAAFKLVTDAHGTAKRMCNRCMCGGFSGSGLFFRSQDSFGTHTPDWVLLVSAAGYRQSEPIIVGEPEFRRTIKRGDQFATMKVFIKLQKLPGRN